MGRLASGIACFAGKGNASRRRVTCVRTISHGDLYEALNSLLPQRIVQWHGTMAGLALRNCTLPPICIGLFRRRTIVTINRFDCFRIDSSLDCVLPICWSMFAHRRGQKRFRLSAICFSALPIEDGTVSRTDSPDRRRRHNQRTRACSLNF